MGTAEEPLRVLRLERHQAPVRTVVRLPRLSGRGECREEVLVPAEHRLVQTPERGAGLDAELGVQEVAGPAEDLQRLGLTPGPVQREHEVPVQALPVRMLLDEAGELGGHLGVPSQSEFGLHQPLVRGEPRLLQPPGLVGDERAVGELRERRPPPEVQRRAQPVSGGFEVALIQGSARLGGEAAEPGRVERVGDDRVSAGPSGQDVGAVRPPQLVDVEVDVAPRGRRRPVAPDGGDQPVDGHRLARSGEQRGQGEPEFRRAADRDQVTIAGNAERPQDVKFHSDSASVRTSAESRISARFVNGPVRAVSPGGAGTIRGRNRPLSGAIRPIYRTI